MPLLHQKVTPVKLKDAIRYHHHYHYHQNLLCPVNNQETICALLKVFTIWSPQHPITIRSTNLNSITHLLLPYFLLSISYSKAALVQYTNLVHCPPFLTREGNDSVWNIKKNTKPHLVHTRHHCLYRSISRFSISANMAFLSNNAQRALEQVKNVRPRHAVLQRLLWLINCSRASSCSMELIISQTQNGLELTISFIKETTFSPADLQHICSTSHWWASESPNRKIHCQLKIAKTKKRIL